MNLRMVCEYVYFDRVECLIMSSAIVRSGGMFRLNPFAMVFFKLRSALFVE